MVLLLVNFTILKFSDGEALDKIISFEVTDLLDRDRIDVVRKLDFLNTFLYTNLNIILYTIFKGICV